MSKRLDPEFWPYELCIGVQSPKNSLEFEWSMRKFRKVSFDALFVGSWGHLQAQASFKK